MKPRIRLYLEVDTVAHGLTIKNAIQNKIAGKDIFEIHGFDFGVGNMSDPNVVWGYLEVRFNSQTDFEEVRDWIKDQVQNHPQIKVWVTKAIVTTHTCTHDDPEVKDCKTTNYLEWER